MQIDQGKCVACSNCVPICPMGAIYIDSAVNRATVNLDECVECFTCHRGMSKEHLNPTLVRTVRGFLKRLRIRFDPEPDVCPTDALTPQDLTWPRIVRRAFSDPLVPHESTGVHGRGTEEVKTNDVTDRVREGEAGFTIEFGRPGVGVRFRDIQKMTLALAPLPVTFEKKNPVFSLMRDPATGAIREDILDEKVLSAIVELKSSLPHAPEVLRRVEEVAPTLDTIVSIGVATRCDPQGDNLLEPMLKQEGYAFYRGKTNLGLGRRPVTATA
ncbi:MAG TPA: 4Fe-4S binding protein [Candidatus Methylomirabilis sp.]|nr:4Fe-4S binding protein [Candidatus Methylomirabilis sp.]HSC72262.1 4Fe-4S binding protein [Candidatus Methylomirabilis sp.]